METWQWILAAASLLLIVHAVRVTLSPPIDDNGKPRREMGCGYLAVAVVVWSFTLAYWVEDVTAGLRLAAGIVCIVFALQLFMKRAPARSILLLIPGLFLVSQDAERLWSSVNRSEAELTLSGLQESYDDSKAWLESIDDQRERLTEDRVGLVDELQGVGAATFDELEGQPAALAMLREVREIDAFLAQLDGRESVLGRQLPQLESAIRRLERRADQEESIGVTLDEGEIRELLREIEEASGSLEGPVSLEEHAEREELRALFEGGLGPG